MRILWQLELFVLNPMHEMQFSKNIFGDSDKKSVFLQQQIPPRLSTMRTTVGLRFLYGYMNYDKQPINIDEQLDLHAMGFPQGWENEPLWR
nr:hypothetical protein [Prevotella sp.]